MTVVRNRDCHYCLLCNNFPVTKLHNYIFAKKNKSFKTSPRLDYLEAIQATGQERKDENKLGLFSHLFSGKTSNRVGFQICPIGLIFQNWIVAEFLAIALALELGQLWCCYHRQIVHLSLLRKRGRWGDPL